VEGSTFGKATETSSLRCRFAYRGDGFSSDFLGSQQTEVIGHFSVLNFTFVGDERYNNVGFISQAA